MKDSFASLQLHQEMRIPISIEDEFWSVTRVPGGWIYRYRNLRQPNSSHSVFVPDNMPPQSHTTI